MKSQRNGRRNASRILLFVLLLAALAGAWTLGKKGLEELSERKEGREFYAQLADGAGPESTEEVEACPSPETEAQAEATNVPELPLPQETMRPQSELDFDALWETCPDAVGWIRIEGTQIDYPVLQGEDNAYYLTHLADGTPNSAGSIMMDCMNDSAFGDMVSILHGHHMRNGSMFGDLDRYGKREYYLEHPVMRLLTPAGDYDVAIFAAYTVNGYSFGYPTSFSEEEAFEAFLRKAVSSTGYETEVEVGYGDRLLLLSTCAYSFQGARYVVIGKILED